MLKGEDTGLIEEIVKAIFQAEKRRIQIALCTILLLLTSGASAALNPLLQILPTISGVSDFLLDFSRFPMWERLFVSLCVSGFLLFCLRWTTERLQGFQNSNLKSLKKLFTSKRKRLKLEEKGATSVLLLRGKMELLLGTAECSKFLRFYRGVLIRNVAVCMVGPMLLFLLVVLGITSATVEWRVNEEGSYKILVDDFVSPANPALGIFVGDDIYNSIRQKISDQKCFDQLGELVSRRRSSRVFSLEGPFRDAIQAVSYLKQLDPRMAITVWGHIPTADSGYSAAISVYTKKRWGIDQNFRLELNDNKLLVDALQPFLFAMLADTAYSQRNYVAFFKYLDSSIARCEHLKPDTRAFFYYLYGRGHYYKEALNIHRESLALDSCEKYLRLAMKEEADCKYACMGLAVVSRERGDFEKAREYHSQVVSLAPEYLPAKYFPGSLALSEGNWTTAIHHFRGLQDLHGISAVSCNSMAHASWKMAEEYQSNGRTDLVARYLDDAEKSARMTTSATPPANWFSYYHLGEIRFLRADFESAASNFKVAIDFAENTSGLKDGLFVCAYLGIVKSYVLRQNFDSAFAYFDRAVSRAGNFEIKVDSTLTRLQHVMPGLAAIVESFREEANDRFRTADLDD